MRALFLVCTLLLSTGCTVNPWVAPYERQFIADPIMGFEQDPVAARYMNHVYEAREAARGAEGGSGGGCGCN
ncbi:DUF4266 domain-containing protein [Microbulbifer sp. JMSA004]|uniref:DUF4266 domain-containing protein n=1 Tax=unclassified Microbulbifer TaxID=2619833 RepID=UPI0024AE2C37|nr:DUF4266 domain-containing protein [Microbulbifer sp. VAAF005]WHI45161.1 DUF4266 domain-containing protein [Microbulbifer sp. VAAF005]